MHALRWISVALFAFAIAAGAGIWLQREATAALRAEIELLRHDNQKLSRLRVEYERLKAAQTPEAELQRLRADRAAAVRLRAEVDSLKTRAEQMEREEAKAGRGPSN